MMTTNNMTDVYDAYRLTIQHTSIQHLGDDKQTDHNTTKPTRQLTFDPADDWPYTRLTGANNQTQHTTAHSDSNNTTDASKTVKISKFTGVTFLNTRVTQFEIAAEYNG